MIPNSPYSAIMKGLVTTKFINNFSGYNLDSTVQSVLPLLVLLDS
jgi:hypothetical protein